MTVGEISRAIESKRRVMRIEAQERASYDYILGTLIVKGVSITLGSKESFPTLQEAYPGVFDEAKVEDKKAEKRMELSALRFRQFAQSYNSKYKEVPKKADE